jgi:cell volume regulation protein A
MAALLAASGSGHLGFPAVWQGTETFLVQMAVGTVVGVAGGHLLVRLMRRIALSNEALYPVLTLAFAAFVYGAASVLNGSGFLAVLLAGVICGDARAPYKREVERFASGLGSIAEIVAFTVLGLTVSLHDILTSGAMWVGLGIAALLALVIRPALVGLLLLPVDLARGERLFVVWAGLKGAVPILLGTFVLGAGIPGGRHLYDVLFVVVLASVTVQGGLVPFMANLLHVPMRDIPLEPWSLGMRFRSEPEGLQRHFVAAGSTADGSCIADLDLGEDAWVSMVGRHGKLLDIHGGTRLEADDEVLMTGQASADLSHLFESPERAE